MSVELTRDGGSVHATGRLTAVFGAMGAAGVVVATRVPEPAVFAVPAGLTVRPDSLQMRLRPARSADLVFDDVELPVRGGRDLPGHRPPGPGDRTGLRIVEHGAVSDMLAEMTVRLRTCGVAQLGAATNDPAAAPAHKIAASDAAMATTIDAVQVMGGTGYMVDTGVKKLMRDAKYCQLYPERNRLARDELTHLSGDAVDNDGR